MVIRESIEELLRKIHDASSRAEVVAAKALLEEKLMLKSKEELVERINTSPNNIEIEIAKWVLWKKSLDKSFEGLMNVIHTSSDEDKLAAAATLLGELGYKEAVEPLIKLLLETASQQIRNGAALGLRDLADQRALKPIAKMIKNDLDNSNTLVYALETLDCHTIVEFLVDIFISQANDYMLRSSVSECIRNTDLSRLSGEIIERCRQKVNEAVSASNEEEDIDQLGWLLEALKEQELEE